MAAALALGGCALNAPPARVAAAAPQQWQAPLPHNGSLTDLNSWWQNQGDPLLVQLIAAAQSASPSLASARARIVQSRAERVAAGAALAPTLDLAGSVARQNQQSAIPTGTTSQIALQASWEIDVFGAGRAARNAAQARYDSASAGWHEARVSVAAETANQYYALRACQQLLLVAVQDAGSRAYTARLSELSSKAGFLSPSDSALARASAADGRSRATAQRAACDIGVKALVALTAMPEPELRAKLAAAATPAGDAAGTAAAAGPATASPTGAGPGPVAGGAGPAAGLATGPTTGPATGPTTGLATGLAPEPAAGLATGPTTGAPAGTPTAAAPARPPAIAIATLPAQTLSQRPDVYSAEQEVAAASYEVGGAQAQRYPRLALSGSVGAANFHSGGENTQLDTWTIGPLSVSVPLFDAGRRRANVDAAQARYELAVSQYQASVRNAVREVEQALVTLNSTSERAADAETALQGYRVAFTATEDRYKNGLASLLDLEDARRTRLSAENTVVNLQQERSSAWVALYRAAGGGWTHPATLANNNQ
ncbi:TolC family protein [Pseudoduganella sp. LjRoot289]|uniref:TolC family protein n=1 Tax=Pseudoduganella sp. LjRoot289 TaxID=3342314 RepID=UPI003ECFCDB7